MAPFMQIYLVIQVVRVAVDVVFMIKTAAAVVEVAVVLLANTEEGHMVAAVISVRQLASMVLENLPLVPPHKEMVASILIRITLFVCLRILLLGPAIIRKDAL
jgi:hypothetical protein